MSDPKLIDVKRTAGLAGQVQFTATVQYPGEEPSVIAFVGNELHGGPVVSVGKGFGEVFVSDPARFGEFSAEWVRRFFGAEVVA